MPGTKNKIEKTKINQWFDSKNDTMFYGIDAFVNGEWVHVSEGKKPLFFTDKKDAQKKMKELKLEA